MPHSARKLPADLQAAMLKPDKPGPSIGKRRTKKAPKIPAWNRPFSNQGFGGLFQTYHW